MCFCLFYATSQAMHMCQISSMVSGSLKSPLIFCNQDHGSFHCLSRADIFLDGKSCPRWWIIEQHFPSAHHVMSSAHVLPHLFLESAATMPYTTTSYQLPQISQRIVPNVSTISRLQEKVTADVGTEQQPDKVEQIWTN